MVLVLFLAVRHMIKDFDFAKKYNLEIKTVVRPNDQYDTFKVEQEELILVLEL